jgi:hypothetical protein
VKAVLLAGGLIHSGDGLARTVKEGTGLQWIYGDAKGLGFEFEIAGEKQLESKVENGGGGP